MRKSLESVFGDNKYLVNKSGLVQKSIIHLDLSIWTCLFGQVHLDPSIWTRLGGPVNLDLSIWTNLFGPV